MATAKTLTTYQDKRDFASTNEPSGTTTKKKTSRKRTPKRSVPRFVVQEHSATAMHWDLRLEQDGVLLSWAVPKGVPEDPKDTRLAIRTEDHPIEYIDFEGTIPKGNYGAGTMKIWDSGTYEPEEEFDVVAGKLHFRFDGGRVSGRYVLVRTKGNQAEGTKEQWILRRLDPPADATREPLPAHVKPMLATLAKLPRDPENWAFEVKWDGIRAIGFAEGGRIRFESRNQNDITHMYPELARLGRALGTHSAVIDGEIVAYDEHGRPSFQTLQSRLGLSSETTIRTRAKHTPVQYVMFDILFLDGHDVTALPFEERRQLLRDLVADDDHWKMPVHHVGAGEDLLAAVVEQGLEGVMAKKLGSPYREGSRGSDWIKIKQQQRQEFVICGWTEGEGRRAGGIGSILLGVYDGDQLVSVGGCGTGFGDKELTRLRGLFGEIEIEDSPFDVGSPGAMKQPGKWQSIRAGSRGAVAVHYLQPKLVCEVEFTEFTRDGTLRHPSYKGLRDDKDARDVVREEPAR
jgi:bifunctional non-homologous end joining protein LigD